MLKAFSLTLVLAACAHKPVYKPMYYTVGLWNTLDDVFTAYVEQTAEQIYKDRERGQCWTTSLNENLCKEVDARTERLDKLVQRWNSVSDTVSVALSVGSIDDTNTALEKAKDILREIGVMR